MKNNKVTNNDADKIAEKSYEVEGYKSNDDTEHGLAMTHEQVSDAYTEGTIDARIDQMDGNNKVKGDNGEEIPRKGFDQ
ncbi:hypothetical protein J2S74_002008 [Evansella vedderi]|uniref:DUF4025 domain-containing protein n=1 Tax=Evansella vedderi TaxID=38282 RepID=A0ABT9ZTV3_9BACI|nr:YozQ family protein [Evansella vedderi]MDQ0254629.1 hypothetical protein [Evansella vedderi]